MYRCAGGGILPLVFVICSLLEIETSLLVHLVCITALTSSCCVHWWSQGEEKKSDKSSVNRKGMSSRVRSVILCHITAVYQSTLSAQARIVSQTCMVV